MKSRPSGFGMLSGEIVVVPGSVVSVVSGLVVVSGSVQDVFAKMSPDCSIMAEVG